MSGASGHDRLVRGDDRYALMAGRQLSGRRREIQRRTAFVGAAACDHQAIGACDDVAFSKCRVILDLDRGKAHLVLAVTGAVRDDLVAVAIGIRQVRVGLAAFGHSTVDGAAINNLGVARRAEIVARGRPTLIVGSTAFIAVAIFCNSA